MPDRRSLTDALHIFGLCSFAVSQPILSLLREYPAFFVARKSEPVDMAWFIVAVCLAFPSCLVVVEFLCGILSKALRSATHHFFMAALASLAVLPLLKKVEAFPGLVVIAILAGGLFLVAYRRAAPVRSFVTVLSVSIVLVPAVFLSSPSIREIVSPEDYQPPASVIAAKNPAPIILIVFDELPVTSLMDPAFHIDDKRFPGFARIAGDGSWYRYAHSISMVTAEAVPAIMTGRLPRGEISPTSRFFPENLFRWLRGNYEINSYEAVTRLCPKLLCRDLGTAIASKRPWDRIVYLLSDTFIVYLHVVAPAMLAQSLPSISGNWEGFVDQSATPKSNVPAPNLKGVNRPRVLDRFIDSITARSRPVLYFLHTTLPHIPWIHYPSGKMYADYSMKMDPLVSGIKGAKWMDDEFLVAQGLRRHLIQVQLVDQFVERLVNKLKDVGIYESSLIMITADHGVQFSPGAWRRFLVTDPEVLRVPMFVKLPHQTTAEIVDRKVLTIDLMPTISEVIGLPIPWPIDGKSLRSPTPLDGDGNEVSAAELAERYPTTRLIKNTFDQSDPDALYNYGNYSRFGGLPTGSQTIGAEPDGIQATVFGETGGSFDPDARFVPGLIAGQLSGAGLPGEPVELAVAVNGIFRVMTRTYRKDDQRRFSALVPEAAFRPGPNRIELFLVSEDTEGAVSFLPLSYR